MPQPKRKKLKWKHEQSETIAKVLEPLLEKFQDRLVDRGNTPQFRAKLRKVRLDCLAAHTGKLKSNTTQYTNTAALKRLLAIVRATTNGIRSNIRRRFPHRKDVQKAFGTGAVGKGLSLAMALTLVEVILAAVSEYPTESAAAGIVARDVAGLQALHADVVQANLSQDESIGANVVSTHVRDSLHAELIALIDEAIGWALIEFANEPETLALFTNPIPTRKRVTPRAA